MGAARRDPRRGEIPVMCANTVRLLPSCRLYSVMSNTGAGQLIFENPRFQKIWWEGAPCPLGRPPPEMRVGYEPEYQLHRDGEPPPAPSECRFGQPEGGQEDRRPAPGGDQGGRHILPLIFGTFGYGYFAAVLVLCVAEKEAIPWTSRRKPAVPWR